VGRADDVPDWRMWMAPAAIVLGLAVGEMAVIFVDAIGAAAGSSFTHPTPAVNIIGNVVVDLSFVLAAISGFAGCRCERDLPPSCSVVSATTA
jgi:hypothetical protein